MNRRLMTILVVALIVATGASYLVYRVVRISMAGAATAATAQVIVAARDLPVGSMVQAADLATGQWVGVVPKGVVARKEDAIGRGVVSTLYAGEPVMESRLAKPGAGAGMASTIPPGMRACAIKVNEVVGVAGFVGPGMRVDVLITGNPPGGTSAEGPRAKTILQNVEVLSAGQNIQKDAEGKPVQVQVVNLLVTPEQAEILSLAGNETRIQLVLRNPTDTEVAKTTGSSLSGLFTGEKPVPAVGAAPATAPKVRKVVAAVKPPPPPATLVPGQYLIEVINGPKKAEAKFEKPPEEAKP